MDEAVAVPVKEQKVPTPAAFVAAWQAAKSPREAAKTLGIRPQYARLYAGLLKRAGVKLTDHPTPPKAKAGLDVVALNAQIATIAKAAK